MLGETRVLNDSGGSKLRLGEIRWQLITRCIILLSVFCTSAQGGTIFDEDWVPPRPAYTPPKMPPPARVAEPPANINPAPPTIAPVPQPIMPAPPMVPSRRLEVPKPVEQARSRDLLKTVFAEQLKDHSTAGRKKLAQSLIDEVPKSTDNPSDQFVLLGGAIDAAKEAGELLLCFRAVDLMAERYTVDGLNVKTDATLKLNVKGMPATGAVDNVRAVMELLGPLIAADDYVTAAKVLTQVKPLAAADAKLLAMLQTRAKSIEVQRTLHDRMLQAVEKLKTSPDDPTANQTIGSYWCFNKGDWAKGLPALTKSADGNLAKLAAMETVGRRTPAALRLLADGWWDVVPKQPEINQTELMNHAAAIYKSLLAGTTGLERTILEKRIAQAAVASEKQSAGFSSIARGGVQLLKLIDTEKDTVAGKFAVQNGDLVTAGSGEQRISIPYHPPKEYDYQVEFTRSAGTDCMIQILSREGKPFIWVLQRDPKFFYQKDGSAPNGARVSRPDPVQNGKRYTSLVQVRNTEVKAFLNGELITTWKTDYTDINPNVPFWALKDKACLGIGVGGGNIAIHSATLIEVTGKGAPTR